MTTTRIRLFIMELLTMPTLTRTLSGSAPGGPPPAPPVAPMALEPPIFAFTACGGDPFDDATERAFAELAAYRALYRQHRRGAARGAAGEVTRVALSAEAVSYTHLTLPTKRIV